MQGITRRLGPRLQGLMVALLLVAVAAWAGTTNFSSLQLDPTSEDTNALVVKNTSGTTVWSISNAGVVSQASGGSTFTLAAANKVLIDGDTTNQTQTAGALDINVGTVTADVSGLDIALTQDSGAAAGTDGYVAVLTMTQNDADADARGVKITAAATANAAAGSYEYGLTYDCAENTAGGCLDGILLTSSGIDAGLTDGIDVSAANITNAVNVGINPILGGNTDSFTIGAADATFAVTRNDAGAVTFLGADDAGAADTVYDTTGAGAITVGSADVTSITFVTDGTGTGEVVLPLQSVAGAELLNDTVDGAQLADTVTLDAALVVAGAFAIDIGNNIATAVTIDTDGTGDAELVLPTGGVSTGEVLDATLLPADQAYPGRGSFTVCGDLVTIADATPVFYGPSMVLVESATVGLARTCNTAATGNVTEATADTPAYTATAFQVLAMDCIVQDVNITSVAFAARSAAAALTPAVGCTVLDGELGCVANVQSTTAIASGATFAIQATGSGADVGDVQFICTIFTAF